MGTTWKASTTAKELDTEGDRDMNRDADPHGLWDFDHEASQQAPIVSPVPPEGGALIFRHPDGCSYRYRSIR